MKRYISTIIAILLIGGIFYISYLVERPQQVPKEEQLISDSLSYYEHFVDSVYNTIPLDQREAIYFFIGDTSPKRYVVEEYLNEMHHIYGN